MDERVAWAQRYELLRGVPGAWRNRLFTLGFRSREEVLRATDGELMRPALWQGHEVAGLSPRSVRALRRALAADGVRWNTCG